MKHIEKSLIKARRGEKELTRVPETVNSVVVNGVMVSAVFLGGHIGYDIQISHPEATAADYLKAMEQAITELPLHRERAPERSVCQGCDLCCRERLPLTSIDVLQLMKAMGIEDLYSFLKRYAWVAVRGRVVDISMLRQEGACCLLDTERRLCRWYGVRPLACQTFICCPHTERALLLRETIINQGEDELVQWWLAEATQKGITPLVHEGDAMIAADGTLGVAGGYRRSAGRRGMAKTGTAAERGSSAEAAKAEAVSPFAGRTSYEEVLLREVCSPALWQALIRGRAQFPQRPRGGR